MGRPDRPGGVNRLYRRVFETAVWGGLIDLYALAP